MATSSVVVARVAATAARQAPDVLGLHGGVLGEVATYGDDGPVRGVRVWRSDPPRLRLHLIVRFGARLDEVADDVRARVAAALIEVAPAFADSTVDVHIADVRPSPPDGDDAVSASDAITRSGDTSPRRGGAALRR